MYKSSTICKKRSWERRAAIAVEDSGAGAGCSNGEGNGQRAIFKASEPRFNSTQAIHYVMCLPNVCQT